MSAKVISFYLTFFAFVFVIASLHYSYFGSISSFDFDSSVITGASLQDIDSAESNWTTIIGWLLLLILIFGFIILYIKRKRGDFNDSLKKPHTRGRKDLIPIKLN